MQLHLLRWLFILLAAVIALPILQAHAQSDKKTDWSHQVELPDGEFDVLLALGQIERQWQCFVEETTRIAFLL